ncbi:hypothetical protein PULV_a4023 [Pseudoalteromonas ulvae UL12]|uniref:hypothetical protein n=1 Tax=Pseudoalteromonas ulvae TaxID=107327 RepID=UPI00186BA247|nr:hypothetical protein [Pseudoalteromonas ulvae]MBE0362211.1 hypothetical protein [Pseudoalteromonas ulvae UL12]
MGYVVFIFAMVGISLAATQVDIYNVSADRLMLDEDQARITAVGNALNRHLMVRGTLPVSLNALIGTSGFEDVTWAVTDDMGYSVTTLNDATMDARFDRGVVFYKSNRDETDADWLANNDCGAGTFANGLQWCKEDQSVYAVVNTLEYQRYLANESIYKLDILAQQIFASRANTGDFPNEHAAGTLAEGELITIPDAVGYVGTPEACNGVFNFDGAIITCEMMFNIDGSAVRYIYENSTNAVIYVNQPYSNTAGVTYRVARPLRDL